MSQARFGHPLLFRSASALATAALEADHAPQQQDGETAGGDAVRQIVESGVLSHVRLLGERCVDCTIPRPRRFAGEIFMTKPGSNLWLFQVGKLQQGRYADRWQVTRTWQANPERGWVRRQSVRWGEAVAHPDAVNAYL